MTLHELLQEGIRILDASGIEESQADAWFLMEDSLQLTRTQYLLRKEETADRAMQERYLKQIAVRARRVPLQHILGVQPFMGYSFLVTEDVLIPRPETEILAEEAIRWLNRILSGNGAAGGNEDPDSPERIRVLDLCTGSGCIGISIALQVRRSDVTASDLSEAALKVARKNAAALGACVEFRQGDLFEPVPERFRLIVSNPPYIPGAQIGLLAPEVRDHDPRCALDGGSDGLAFYRRIAAEAPSHLENGGRLLLEIGYDQEQAVTRLLAENGFEEIYTIKDLAGYPRIISGILT